MILTKMEFNSKLETDDDWRIRIKKWDNVCHSGDEPSGTRSSKPMHLAHYSKA